MTFEWDEKKRLANLEKHGIDFAEAESIFGGSMIVRRDSRKDYQEARWVALGKLKGFVIYLAYTVRGQNISLISLRRANKS